MSWTSIHKKPWQRSFSPSKLIALAFALIIFIGTALLCLPAASSSGQSRSFLDAFFTATSATCVTGLVPADTYSHWSGFGQLVILILIELGGLGFMSVASLVIMAMRGKIGLKQRMVMAQALSIDDMRSVWKLQKLVIFGSLLVQTLGAVVLFFRFLPQFGPGIAAKWGVFHSVSAFCNAGFDLFGQIQPGIGAIAFNRDPVVCITLMSLVVIGGLGFFVWDEVLRLRSWKKFSVYTKLVLLTTGALILCGAALFLLLEWNNPQTMGDMSPGHKLMNAFFQSITLRTAGFATLDQASLTDPSKAISILFMLIGGSSGSTAGGIKTVTFVVLILFLFTRLRNLNTVTVFRRRILPEKLMDAMTIAGIMISLGLVGSIFLCATSPVSFTDALFEAVSALGTVGLTANVTPLLAPAARLLIILFMYFGRVGILTLSLGFLAGSKTADRYQYAHTNLLIG